MPERLLDREMMDAYLTALEAVDPETAGRIEAAYENTADNDEELAGELLEALHEHDLIPHDRDSL